MVRTDVDRSGLNAPHGRRSEERKRENMASLSEIRSRLRAIGQEHLLTFYDELPEASRHEAGLRETVALAPDEPTASVEA